MNFGVKSIYFLNTSLPFFSPASSSVPTTLHPANSGTNQASYPRLKPGDPHAAPQPLGNHSPRVRGTHTKKTHKICTGLSSTDGIPSSSAAGTRPHCSRTACSTGPESVRPPCPNLQPPERGVLSAFPALSEGVCSSLRVGLTDGRELGWPWRRAGNGRDRLRLRLWLWLWLPLPARGTETPGPPTPSGEPGESDRCSQIVVGFF